MVVVVEPPELLVVVALAYVPLPEYEYCPCE